MAKADAPNYRKATDERTCGSCKAWDSSATPDPMTGYCEWYDFNCRADHTCDAWAASDFEKAWSVVKNDDIDALQPYCYRYDEHGNVDDESCNCWDCQNPMGYAEEDDTKLARWLRNTANAGTPYDDFDWDGKVLTVYSGDDVERYTLADLKEAGAL